MKRGFTLMELMVYMAILGIIVLIAGEAFSNSTKFRVRTNNMVKATQEAENVAMLFKDDVGQMGAKSSMESGDAASGSAYGNNFSTVYSAVYMDPANDDADKVDSSSFTIVSKNGFDSLTIRRLRYDDDGHYFGVEEVAWFVKNGSLWRNCKMLQKVGTLSDNDPCSDGANSTPDDVEMASGVETFNVVAAKPKAFTDAVQVFPASGETEFRLVPRVEDSYVSLSVTNESGVSSEGGESQILSGFFSNYSTTLDDVLDESNRKLNELIVIKNETTTETSWKTLCANYGNFSFEQNQEYEISFKIPYPSSSSDLSQMFVPGVDHMSVGIRSRTTGTTPVVGEVVQLNDFMFFPPLDTKGAGTRSMRFTVPNKVENVCLAFTFACYSPLVSQGRITITDLKVKTVPNSSYDFSGFATESNKNDKQNVKALQLNLTVKRGGETGEVNLAIPVPSNGPRD